jgi:hypothetical protein
LQLGDPTKLPGPLVMLAVAVPPAGSIGKPAELTVIVSVWFVPAALVAVDGVIEIVASPHVLLAGPLLTSPLTVVVPFVVRGSVTPPTTILDVAETTVVPTTADVITTLQLAVVPPPA